MNRNTSASNLKEHRRRLISSLLIRRPGITQRQIQETIGKQVLNPETNEPYALGTINNDIQRIRQGWQEKAEREYGVWIADESAKLDEVETQAWGAGTMTMVLKCMERRAKMLGLDKPERLDLSGTVEFSHNVTLTDEQRTHAIAQLFERFSETPD